MTELLVVAGEASGDRAAAHVLAALRLGPHRAFGMGGAALESAGMEMIADLRSLTALGIGEVAAKAGPIAIAHHRLLRAARRRRPRAALLVNTASSTRTLPVDFTPRGCGSFGTSRRRSGPGVQDESVRFVAG